MSLRSHARHGGRPPGSERYRRRFLSHVHHLIGQGFRDLSRGELKAQDETIITGLLTSSIEDYLDSPRSPRWAERYFIQDERHLNDSERKGKRRLRVDFELTSSHHRPRPRFQIEAKRLKSPEAQSLAAYLGEDGLGSFLSRRYAKDQPWAGMMGYVQTDTVDQWADRVGTALGDRPADFSVAPETEIFFQQVFDPLLPDAYRSDHLREDSPPIEIHHLFLRCH